MRRWTFHDGWSRPYIHRRGEFFDRKSIADENVETSEKRPGTLVTAVGFGNPSFLDLVLLLQRVDSVFALNVGTSSFPVTGGVDVVDGVGDLLPSFLTEVTAVEVEVAFTPGVDEGGSCVFGPAVFAAGVRR